MTRRETLVGDGGGNVNGRRELSAPFEVADIGEEYGFDGKPPKVPS